MGNHSRDDTITPPVTDVPATDVPATDVPATNVPGREKRYRRFLVQMLVPLGLHYGDYDIQARYSRVANKVNQVITEKFALSADTRIVSLDPMNWDTCPGETLTTAVFGVFFDDVSRTELDTYAAYLATVPTKDLVKDGDPFLPATEVSVPTLEQFEALRTRTLARRAQAQAFRSGQLTPAPAGKPAAPPLIGVASTEKTPEEVADFNEWDNF